MNSRNLKYTADYIHDGTGFRQGQVLVTDQDGKVIELVPGAEAGEDVMHLEGVLCPGFVNAHCHLELSYMKGLIPEHTGLVDFLVTVMRSRAHPAGEIARAATEAESAMRDAGIVVVGDIANTTATAGIKSRGTLYYHTFVEAIGVKDADAPARLAAALKTLAVFAAAGQKASVVPHAPYSVSASLMQAIDALGGDPILSIHNQESPQEDFLFRGEPGGFQRLYEAIGQEPLKIPAPAPSSLRAWLPRFTRRQPLIAVHDTFSSESDIRFAMESTHPFYWCLCPGANLYIENRLPPLDRLLAAGARIVLGTDSLASNHGLSILEEIRHLAAGFPALSLEQPLAWATSSGAEALGVASRFGSFRAGATPGILQLHPLSDVPGTPRLSPLTRVNRLK